MQTIKTGIQLFSVREPLSEDFEGTLRSLANMNIQGVEFAFFYGGMEPVELAELLKKINLETCGIYEGFDNICDADHKVYDYAGALGCKYLTSGFSLQELEDDLASCLEKAKKACAAAKTKNITICYHAHAHEFEKLNGEYYLDILLKEVPDMAFEADTAWIKAGGEVIVGYMQKHADRIPMIHAKDLDENGTITELGNGVIDFGAVVKFAKNANIEWISYEQDITTLTALESAEISLVYLNEIMSLGNKNITNDKDPRNIFNGSEIPSEGYSDQPYVVKTQDGAWLCVMTTGCGAEGEHGQHIVAIRSTDFGKTWLPPVDIEPADGPEASWAMPLITPSGRIYVFYTYNSENMREVIADEEFCPGGAYNRVDSLGEYAFKYSDDGGVSWSKDRYFIPVREMAIDRNNPYGGSVKFFWGVGKPVKHDKTMYMGFTKVGRFGTGTYAVTEVCFLRSDNILTESDPNKIEWTTLPDGDQGLRSPEGAIAEETSLTVLSDGSLFCTYRTVAGHPCHAYSRDGGCTWTKPEFMTSYPGGPVLNNPRGPNFVRRLESGPYAGRYIYWYYNKLAYGYDVGSRNTAWLLGGIEQDSPEGKVIHWGQPEVVLYVENLEMGFGYPDFIEEGDRFFITATQKIAARVHEVPALLMSRLWETFAE